MDYKAEIEKIKEQGKADRQPYYTQIYANFSSLRIKIMEHVRGLEDQDPRAVSADQINASIDDLLTLMQIMTGQAENDDDFKAFLEERHFFVIPSA